MKRDDPYETPGITEANVEPKKETHNFDHEERKISEEAQLARDYEDLEHHRTEESKHEPENNIKQDAEKPMEVEPTEYETQNYPYDQNYEHTQETMDPQYQNQYDQNYEQPYTEQQQYENFEQYPQQFTDPNTQYDQHYENYETDANYQGDQNYDALQYGQEYQSEQNAETDSKLHKDALQKQDDPNTAKIVKEEGFEQNGGSRTQIENNPSES